MHLISVNLRISDIPNRADYGLTHNSLSCHVSLLTVTKREKKSAPAPSSPTDSPEAHPVITSPRLFPATRESKSNCSDCCEFRHERAVWLQAWTLFHHHPPSLGGLTSFCPRRVGNRSDMKEQRAGSRILGTTTEGQWWDHSTWPRVPHSHIHRTINHITFQCVRVCIAVRAQTSAVRH